MFGHTNDACTIPTFVHFFNNRDKMLPTGFVLIIEPKGRLHVGSMFYVSCHALYRCDSCYIFSLEPGQVGHV